MRGAKSSYIRAPERKVPKMAFRLKNSKVWRLRLRETGYDFFRNELLHRQYLRMFEQLGFYIRDAESFLITAPDRRIPKMTFRLKDSRVWRLRLRNTGLEYLRNEEFILRGAESSYIRAPERRVPKMAFRLKDSKVWRLRLRNTVLEYLRNEEFILRGAPPTNQYPLHSF